MTPARGGSPFNYMVFFRFEKSFVALECGAGQEDSHGKKYIFQHIVYVFVQTNTLIDLLILNSYTRQLSVNFLVYSM